jgi:hypothetical protein
MGAEEGHRIALTDPGSRILGRLTDDSCGVLAGRASDVVSSDSWIEPSIWRGIRIVRVAGEGPGGTGPIGPSQRSLTQ